MSALYSKWSGADMVLLAEQGVCLKLPMSYYFSNNSYINFTAMILAGDVGTINFVAVETSRKGASAWTARRKGVAAGQRRQIKQNLREREKKL